LSAGLRPDPLEELTLLPDSKAGSWRGVSGQGKDTNERRGESGRRRKRKVLGGQGRDMVLLPAPLLIIGPVHCIETNYHFLFSVMVVWR